MSLRSESRRVVAADGEAAAATPPTRPSAGGAGRDGAGAVPAAAWFLVLPDRELPPRLLAALDRLSADSVLHASGRPWLLGQWPPGSIAVGAAGSTRVAAIGQHGFESARLDDVAARVRSVSDLDSFSASSVGSFHLVASVAGCVRTQGTVTGLRRVYRARVDGVALAADRGDVLARLLRAGLDAARVALWLLNPSPSLMLAGSPWRGVDVLAPDRYLVLEPGGGDRSVRRWSAPEPTVPMAGGAATLRDALAAAIEARVRGREVVSCDLGGLDSTSVCCLAATAATTLVAYTAESRDPLAEDVDWALRTVARLGRIEHHVIPAREIPLFYHRVDLEDRLDEPCPAAIDRERWLVLARRAARRGSRMHLTGIGGDELLYGSQAHLHDLFRSRPAVAWRQLRGFAAKYRWPRGEMVRQLLDGRGYPAWLRDAATQLTDAMPSRHEPQLEWGHRPRLPPWATRDAVDEVRRLLVEEASTARPLAERRGHHRDLEMMQFAAGVTRQLEQMAGRIGVSVAAPYYDDRVVEAGLAVRPEERITPWRYKPLIIEAMRGVVPDESLGRQTSDDGDCDDDPGLREHRRALLEICEDARLARLGLIDVDALRATCSRPLPPSLREMGVLRETLACEVWLRTLDEATDERGDPREEVAR